MKMTETKRYLPCGFCDGEGCCVCDHYGVLSLDHPLYDTDFIDVLNEETDPEND